MKTLISAAAVTAALLFAGAAQANIIGFYAALNGAAEAPPNNSLGTGFTAVIMDDVAHTMEVIVDFTGLTGTTTASHVHCCTTVPGAGTSGIATELPLFTGFPVGVTSGHYDHIFDTSLTATWNPAFTTANGGTALGAESAFIAGMRAGRAYLNVHSTFRPGGEIRGFLAIPEPATAGLTLLALSGLALSRRRRRG